MLDPVTQWTMCSRRRPAQCQCRAKMQIKFFTSDLSETKSLDKLGCGEECGRGLVGGGWTAHITLENQAWAQRLRAWEPQARAHEGAWLSLGRLL